MTALEHLSFSYLNQDLYQATLSNGMRVVILPKPGFQETTAMLKVDFGGIDTRFTLDGKTVNLPCGLAHYLEHQVFENNGQQDFSRLFTSLGSDSNAFTGFTSTHYFFSGIDHIKESLHLLLELVSQARFTDSSIQKEAPIIKQEIDLYQDDPEHQLYSAVLAALFPKTALAVDLAGTVDSIDTIDKSILTTAFDTFYRPQQMTLVVVGDLVAEEVYKWLTAEEQVLNKPRQKLVNRSAIDYKPVQKKQTLQMEVALPKLGIGFRARPISGSVLLYKTGLRLYLNMLLGWTSMTYQKWYDAGKIDDSFDVILEVTDRFQFVMVLLDTNEPIGMSAKIKQVLKKGISHQDVSEEHLMSLKKEMYGEFLSSFDRVDELASLYLEHSDHQLTYLDFPEVLDQLTLDRVLAIGQDFFSATDVVDVTIFPNR